MSTLKITPFKGRACAAVSVPGSKSITNRALLLAAMSDYPVKLFGPLASRDSSIMMDCLRALGYDVSESEGSVTVSGECSKKASLFVGNAGTAARFLTAFVCSQTGGEYSFDSDEAMRRRPMRGLIEAMRSQGASFAFKGAKDCFPFTVKTCGLKGGEMEIDAAESSQILSAVLMAAPLAYSDTLVRLKGGTVSRPFVAMTLKMMADFGFCAETLEDGSYKIFHGVTCSPAEYSIEPDATAAGYPAALAAVAGGAVLIKDFPFSGMQGDAEFVALMEKAGLVKTARAGKDLLVAGASAPSKPLEFDFNDISDTFLTLAASASAISADVKITGIAHTRRQESDRVAAAAREAAKIARKTAFGEDFIRVEAHPFGEIKKCVARPARIETYEDHRIAMSFALPGCADAFGDGEPWIEISNPECCSKTWPGFFEALEKARTDSGRFRTVSIDGGAAVGKSSVSKECAAALGFMHVDTGAHYRTLAYILTENALAPESGEAEVCRALEKLEISAVLEGSSAKMAVGGAAVEDALIRTERVNACVSQFAAMPKVREFLKGYQRSMADFARKSGFGGIVMEGRDIGSVIFPDADAKIFLDADEQTRAKRRAAEGISDSISKRDALDRNRKTAPLVCPEGAVTIDTSRMTKAEVVAAAMALIVQS